MLDRETVLIPSESELRHRITCRILPQRFRHIWTSEEVAQLNIPDIWMVPIPSKAPSFHDTVSVSEIMKIRSTIEAFFTLEPVEVMKRRYCIYWLQNMKDVLDALNGN